MTVVFSEAWFEQHQVWLLRLLSWPVVGRVLRRVLAIRPHDIGHTRPIVALGPHYYVVDNDDGTYTADVRTHAKFGKRLYYRLRWVWEACHAWDMVVANRLCPSLNVGFDTLTVYPDPSTGGTTCDGTVQRIVVSETWANIRTGAGTAVSTTSSTENVCSIGWDPGNTDMFSQLYRAYFTFNTSPIKLGATVTSASFSLMGSALGSDAIAGAAVNVFGASLGANNTLATTDFGAAQSTPFSSPIVLGSFAIGSYNAFTLNASGLGNIVLGGISAFAMRESTYDATGTQCPWGFCNLQAYMADQAATTNDPKLDVTFTAPSPFLPVNRLRPRVFAPGRAR